MLNRTDAFQAHFFDQTVLKRSIRPFYTACLIRSNLFNLPKDLPEGEGIDWNVVILDATEIPIQRP
ncbi:hypothetical protein ABLT80_16175, partial [Acinetobacter schindleri]|uniref:hypothetical protein n=1 Tax=Acinetobacter schindleri TaxID=108981 RepID=UPI0032B51BAA